MDFGKGGIDKTWLINRKIKPGRKLKNPAFIGRPWGLPGGAREAGGERAPKRPFPERILKRDIP